MTGIEILFAEEIFVSVWNAFVWHWGYFFAGLGAIAMIGLGLWITFDCSGNDGSLIAFIIVAVILGATCFFGFKSEGSVDVYDHTEYKIIVDESTDMNEFFNKYELIEIEGKIYHVKNEERLN